MARTGLVLLAALILGSCAPRVACDVLRLHTLPPPAGERIRVEPRDAALAPSLEFAGYRALVEQELQRIGYVPTEDADAPLRARIAYSIDAGPTRVVENWPYCSFRYHYWRGRLVAPYWYGYGCWDPPRISTYEQYIRELTIDILRRRSDGTADVLFEGRVRSVGGNDRLSEVMPYLVAAMFQNFPGESGVWKTVTIEQEEIAPLRPGASPQPPCAAAVMAPPRRG
jgi:hypothetical protein